jgi:ABC-2 type transport system permease protein
VNPSLGGQLRSLSWRSIKRTVRQPIVFLPSLLFPLFMLLIMSGADRATGVPGFPTDSYVSFIIGAMMIQAGAGAMTVAGGAMGDDIETGFLNRLVLTPMRAVALVAAQLAGVLLMGVVQSVLILATGLAAGARLEAGVGGALVLVGFVMLVIFAFGALGLMVAVRTGSGESVQGLFSLTLALFFMSSMAMPRNLIDEGWFKAIATGNPISYLIEGARSLFITGWDAEALALGGGIAAGVLIVCMSMSVAGLRRRIVAK